MRTPSKPLLGTALLAAGSLATMALSAPPGEPTTPAKMSDKAVVKTYARYDAKGHRIGSRKWRVTTAGGNCCEVLVTTTRTGRLVEFGGTYPAYSDDKGKTWTEIQPLSPSTSRLPNPGPRQIAGGEGTVVMAPGGDIVGVGWDPYSGDRLQSFFYAHATKTWSYQEAPLHEPFYDREWVAVAKGPFTIAGTTVPWVSLVLSNANRVVVLMSTDGLNYFTPTQRDLDAVANGTHSGYLPVTKDPDLDYMQEHSDTGLVALGRGALSFDATQTCKTQMLQPDGTWACWSLPDQTFQGTLHTDSRGWLHEMHLDADEVTYRISKNGGRTWSTTHATLPGGVTAVSYDFKANGKLGLTALLVHAQQEDKTDQDMVLRFDTHKAKAKHLDTLFVGGGNMAFTVGLDVTGLVNGTKTNRVDFSSVAILPDGSIAASFADKTYDDPALAILM